MSEETREQVERILGNPAICEFQPSVQKVRATLFFFSAVAIAVTIGGLNIDQGSSFLGVKFSNLDGVFVNKMLFWVISYLMLHFAWGAFDCFLEWRARLTGTKVAFVTVGSFGSESADYPGDPRQSTLYNWWSSQAKQIGNLKVKANEINASYEACVESLNKKAEEDTDPNWKGFQQTTGQALKSINELKNSIEKVEKALASQRIPASLARFDKWFHLFLCSQNFRWLLIELSLPLTMGGTSLWLLLNHP